MDFDGKVGQGAEGEGLREAVDSNGASSPGASSTHCTPSEVESPASAARELPATLLRWTTTVMLNMRSFLQAVHPIRLLTIRQFSGPIALIYTEQGNETVLPQSNNGASLVYG